MSDVLAGNRPGVRDLLHRFQDVVADAPERDAVVTADGTVLSFAELDLRVRRLAWSLVGSGVQVGGRVGVCVERGADLLTALLAVWSAGAAYVPLDPAYPTSRLGYMAADAMISAVICADDRPWPPGVRVVAPRQSGHEPPADQLPSPPDSIHTAAYVIYTSGSTGKPKGVTVTRAAVAHLIDSLDAFGAFGAHGDTRARVVWNASASFDASVQQWTRVFCGHTILTLTEELRTDPAALAQYLVRQRATDLDVTPTHWAALREHVVEAAREHLNGIRLFIGGEAVPTAMWRDLAALGSSGTVRAINLYGPTECTVDATAARIEGDEPHIGTALPGVCAFVLGDDLRPADEGELYLGGPGVATGYLRRPALTAERFIASPFGPPGTRIYRTGDRVHRREDGTLGFLGRVDHQVKVNGIRIELGEVEAVLAEHPSVAAAIVALRENPKSGRALVAYWVPAQGANTDSAPLRAHLQSRLPEQLAGMLLTRLEALPMGISGKVDRAALPDPVELAQPQDADEDPTPTGSLELSIAESWRAVLGQDQVLATDDFFALGGHSLVALRVIADLKKQHGVVIGTRTVYQHPRLRDLARVVEAEVTRSA